MGLDFHWNKSLILISSSVTSDRKVHVKYLTIWSCEVFWALIYKQNTCKIRHWKFGKKYNLSTTSSFTKFDPEFKYFKVWSNTTDLLQRSVKYKSYKVDLKLKSWLTVLQISSKFMWKFYFRQLHLGVAVHVLNLWLLFYQFGKKELVLIGIPHFW